MFSTRLVQPWTYKDEPTADDRNVLAQLLNNGDQANETVARSNKVGYISTTTHHMCTLLFTAET
jgi:hypothetical protein